MQQPVDLSTLLSLPPRWRPRRSNSSGSMCSSAPAGSRTRPKSLPAFRCRGVDATQVDSMSASGNDGAPPSHMGKFLASSGRRSLTLAILIPLMLPEHHMAKAVDVGEASVIQNGVRNYLSKAKAAGMLRLAFHDAGTFDLDGGMNGSIVYELDRPENVGLNKSLKVLGKAKMEIEQTQQVSWADLIAVAGAEAVSLCGGPAIPVRLGRLDVRIPDPQGRLPQETLDAAGLKNCFLKKGFSAQELVALSGAHTIGSKGFGSPIVFDNSYFKILLEKPWTSSAGMSSMIGLPSDRALVEDEECLRWINIYADDQAKFFYDFKNAYIKLVNSGASWKSV